MRALLVPVVVMMAVATSVKGVETGTLGPVRRWYVHYDLSYAGGKHWQTPDHVFNTLEACLQFVGQGSWAKAEHCDGSRF